jgi:hypothetical protein
MVASLEWKHITVSIEKKFKTLYSTGKVFMAYWDAQGTLLLGFLDHKAKVKTDCCCTTL